MAYLLLYTISISTLQRLPFFYIKMVLLYDDHDMNTNYISNIINYFNQVIRLVCHRNNGQIMEKPYGIIMSNIR
jgi:hypothetical protein